MNGNYLEQDRRSLTPQFEKHSSRDQEQRKLAGIPADKCSLSNPPLHFISSLHALALFQLLLEVCSSHLLIWLSILLDGCGLIFILLQISLLNNFSIQLFPSSSSLLCSVLSTCVSLFCLPHFISSSSSSRPFYPPLSSSCLIFPSYLLSCQYTQIRPLPPLPFLSGSLLHARLYSSILNSLFFSSSLQISPILTSCTLSIQAAVASLMHRIYG